MARGTNPRTFPAVPQQQVMHPPQRFPVSKQHEWTNEVTEEKVAIAAGEGIAGTFGVAISTAMTVRNSEVTVVGLNALDRLRNQGGTPQHQRLINQIINDFQADLVDSNRGINAVAAQNIMQGVNRPYQKPHEKARAPGFWDRFFGDSEE